MIKGGFCHLPNAYAERLQGQILLDKTVSNVSWKDDSLVQVVCTDGSSYEADAVVSVWTRWKRSHIPTHFLTSVLC